MGRIVFLIKEECLVAAIQFSYFHNLISPSSHQAVNPESSPPPGRSPRPARRPARTKTSMSHVYRERYGVTNIPPRNTGYKVGLL